MFYEGLEASYDYFILRKVDYGFFCLVACAWMVKGPYALSTPVYTYMCMRM